MIDVTKTEHAFKPCIKKAVVVHAAQINEEFTVETLEGPLKGNPGDYLIIGVRGERYPIRKDIFEETYNWVHEAKEKTYEVRYENGTSHVIPAISLQQALDSSIDSIRSCLPKNFDPKNLVRPVLVRNFSDCVICGIETPEYIVTPKTGHQVGICDKCYKEIKPILS